MVWHWTFNTVGFCIALYLGYLVDGIWIPIVAFITINLLWFYSTYFKRQPFTGNLLVAAFTGFVPISVGIFNLGVSPSFSDRNVFEVLAQHRYFLVVILFTGLLAFLMNLIRELVKDVIDIRGDLKLAAKTFPIRFGIKKTRKLIFVLFTLLLLFGGWFLYFIVQIVMDIMLTDVIYDGLYIKILINFNMFIVLLTTTLIVLVVAAFFTFRKHAVKSYKTASLLLKLAMFFGLLIPLFL
jgi:4-hydroxybenzoate polyprenyltransferase